nr:MAG TPA: hypothetical protein [Caudoviricetes sp.]DAV02447.1 MAG TPA: hypothetical protein [Caudoviricetes sp.]DAW52265.1 MAG TPA: hypothetical protein [Caudoviricetes sp.]
MRKVDFFSFLVFLWNINQIFYIYEKKQLF